MVQRVDFGGVSRSINLWGEERQRRREEEARQRAERAQLIGTVLGGGAGFALGGPMGAAAGAGIGRSIGGASVGAPGSSADLVQSGFQAASVAQQQGQVEADRDLANAYVQQEESAMGFGPGDAGRTTDGRPIVKNPDGSVSTERTMTVEVDGKHYNIPTMYGGKEVSPDEAFQIARQNNFTDKETGKAFTAYTSQQEAEAAAQARSAALASDPNVMAAQGQAKQRDARVAALKAALAKTNDPARTVQLTAALQGLFHPKGAGKTSEQFVVWDKDRKQVGVFDNIQSAQRARPQDGFISRMGTDLPSAQTSQTETWANATSEQLTAVGIKPETLPPNTVAQVSSRGQFKFEAAPRTTDASASYETITDPEMRKQVGAAPGDLVQRNKQTNKVEIVRAPTSNTNRLLPGYEWANDQQTEMRPIKGSPADTKVPDTITYQSGNNNVTDFYKNGKLDKSVTSPKWQPGSLARVEEFPVGDDKLKVIRYNNDGEKVEEFEVKRFAPGTGDESMDDIARRLLQKHIRKEKLTPEEMNALKYIGLKGNPIGQVIGSSIGIPGLFRPDDRTLMGGAGTKEEPYSPATLEDAQLLPKGSFFIHPETKKIAQVLE